MTTITFKGDEVHTVGELPTKGKEVPNFTLTNNELSDVSLSNFKGKKLVLNIFPSLDTGVCAASVIQFNKMAANLKNVNILCVSADLPFAHKRFCESKDIDNVVTLSTFRSPDFGKDFGVKMQDGPLKGLEARAIVVIDESGKVIYTEQVPEITQEPNYDAVLKHLQ